MSGMARPYNVDSGGKSPSKLPKPPKPFRAREWSGFLEIVRAVSKPAGFAVRAMRSGRRFYFARFRKGSDFARRRRMTALKFCPLCAESDRQTSWGGLTLRAQEPTFNCLFDNLVDDGEHASLDGKIERLGGVEVDHELDLRDLVNHLAYADKCRVRHPDSPSER